MGKGTVYDSSVLHESIIIISKNLKLVHIKSQSIDDVTNVDECSSVSSLVVARFGSPVSLFVPLPTVATWNKTPFLLRLAASA